MNVVGSVAWRGNEAARGELQPHIEGAGFALEAFDSARLGEKKAALFFLTESGPMDPELVRDAVTALDHGVNVILVAPKGATGDRSSLESYRRALIAKGVEPGPVTISGGEVREAAFDAVDVLRVLWPAARRLRQNDSLKVDLSDRARTLLQRSFHDSSEIRLSVLEEQAAPCGVYSVIASKGGEHPLPYVAKIATRANILKELYAFEHYVRDYVPFGNRPNFLMDRSYVAGTHGVLVGQLAERVVPLDKAVRRDGAGAAIHELFASVLHRWWSNSQRSSTPTGETTLSLTLPVRNWLIPDDHRDATARRQALLEHRARAGDLGLDTEPHGKIRSLLGDHPVRLRQGTVHGDLKCGNVLVRGGTPLLIDFSHAARGALLSDPAWLEVSLVFGRNWGPEWPEVVDRLYDLAALRSFPALHFGEDYAADAIHHLCGAVRSIRRNAMAISVAPHDDYARVVGASLIRFASIRRTQSEARDRAARAYAVASRIAAQLSEANLSSAHGASR